MFWEPCCSGGFGRCCGTFRQAKHGPTASSVQRSAPQGRVVGNAMAANPVCLALPCHRVIRGDGTWHGYAYGDRRKRWLLAHEQK